MRCCDDPKNQIRRTVSTDDLFRWDALIRRKRCTQFPAKWVWILRTLLQRIRRRADSPRRHPHRVDVRRKIERFLFHFLTRGIYVAAVYQMHSQPPKIPIPRRITSKRASARKDAA